MNRSENVEGQPSISVIIPCHNAEKWIRRALSSVFDQFLKPSQVIAVVDSSSDRSAQVIREEFPSVEVYEVSFGNAAAARNVGISKASGELLAFLDADDYWLPRHLMTSVDLLIQEKKCVAVINGQYGFYENDLTLRRGQAWVTGEQYYFQDEEYFKLFLSFPSLCMPSLVCRKSRMLEIDGFDEAFKRRHDIEMWLRLIHQQQWAYKQEITVAVQRDTPGSISRNIVDASRYMGLVFVKNDSLYKSKYYKKVKRRMLKRYIFRHVKYGKGISCVEPLDKEMLLAGLGFFRYMVSFWGVRFLILLALKIHRFRRRQ